MTYSEAIARGSGVIEVFIAIDGFPYVCGTSPDAPTDSWYTDGGYSYHQGLDPTTVRFGCDAQPGEVWPETRGADIVVHDPDDTLAALLITEESAAGTELTETLSATATTATVVDTSELASSGVVHVDLEAMSYTGKSATALTGLTRGIYGSAAVEHLYDDTAIPECAPDVLPVPCDLSGRRCVIYAGERRNGVLSATEQVWVGYVSYQTDTMPGEIRFGVDHIIEAVKKGTVFSWLPAGRLRGLYVPNYDGARWGRLTLDYTTALDVVTDETAEFHENIEALVAATITAVTGEADWHMGWTADGRLWIEYAGSASRSISVSALDTEGEGALMYLLGFTQGGARFTIPPAGGRVEAESWPASVFTILSSRITGLEARAYLRSGEAAQFVESYARAEYDGAEDLGAVPILNIDTDDDYLVLAPWSDFGGLPWHGEVMVRGDGPAPIISQTWGLHSLRLHEAVRLMWSGQTYTGALSLGYTAPRRWLARPMLEDGDVDWDELEALMDRVPAVLSTVEYELSEPTDFGEVLTGPLLACGIYAYVKNDGTVGWAMAQAPSALSADSTVTDAILDAERSVELVTARTYRPLVNSLKLVFESQYETDTSFQSKTAYILDTKSIQRYSGQAARDMVDPLGPLSQSARELKIYVAPATVKNVLDHRDEITRHVASTIGGLLSRPRPGVRLAVTPVARTLEIGEAVLLTTQWVRDTATGGMGVSAKVAIVLGWERSFEFGRVVDYLDLMLIDAPPAAISPAARATAWDSGSKTLTFAATDLYCAPEDDSDLDYFTAGDAVLVFAEDNETPSVLEPAIDSVDVDAGTIVLTSAPAISVPAIVRFQQYVDVTARQQIAGWVWLADDSDGQVQDSRTGWRWA